MIFNVAAIANSNPFDLYIKSDGNDSNNGTSPSTPVATVSALQTKALAKGNGVRLRFLDEATYRELLDLNTLNNVLVDANYSILNAANIVSGTWTQPDSVTYPNVWSIAWTSTGATMDGSTMLIDNSMPSYVTSISLCNSTSFSFYRTGNNSTSGTLYVNSGTNPNSDGKVYQFMKRAQGINLGHSSSLKKLVTLISTSNDGSTRIQNSALVSRVLAAYGHKHNLYHGTGAVDDSIVFDWSVYSGQTYFVGYESSLTGKSITAKRCMAIAPSYRGSGGAFYSHSLDASVLDTSEINACIAVNVTNIGGYDATNGMLLTNCYGKVSCMPNAIYGVQMIRNLFDSSLGTGGNGSFNKAGADLVFQNNAIYNTGGASTNNFRLIKGNSLTFYRNSLVSTGTRRFASNEAAAGADIVSMSVTYCVIQNGGGIADLVWKLTGQNNFTSNYNIYLKNHATNQFVGIWNGTTYNSLSSWQAATGQDAQSVYLTLAQQTSFWLGNPANGDFRINPNAQVTAGNGTVYTGTFPDGTPLTNAGVQEYYNHNTREVVTGQPTRWPTVPTSYAECVNYIKNPSGWNFYP